MMLFGFIFALVLYFVPFLIPFYCSSDSQKALSKIMKKVENLIAFVFLCFNYSFFSLIWLLILDKELFGEYDPLLTPVFQFVMLIIINYMYTIITNNQLKANEKKQCWKITFVFLSITCLVLCFEKRSFTYLYYLAFPLSMLVSDYISLDDAMFSPDIPRKSIKDSLKSYNKALISRFVKKREGTLRVGQFILCILINITVSTLILVPKLFCIFKPVAIALKGCIYGSIISIIILGIIALKLRYSK